MSAFGPLLRAELRARRAFALPAVFLGVVGASWALRGPGRAVAGDPPLAAGGPAVGLAAGALLLALALVTVQAAFGGARRRGTDAYLLGLPVGPGHVFGARLAACLAVLAPAPLLRAGLAAGHLAYTGHGSWAGLGLATAAELAQLVAFAGLAVTVARLGRLAWVALGVVALAAALAPATALLDVQAPLAGPRPAVAAAPVLGWLGVGALGAAATGRAFGAAARAPGPVTGRASRLATAALVLLAVGLPLVVTRAAGRGAPEFPPSAVTLRTGVFRLAADARLTGPARALAGRADAIHGRTAELLGAESDADDDERIDLEVVDSSWAAGDLEPGWIPVDPTRPEGVELAALRLAEDSARRHLAGRTGWSPAAAPGGSRVLAAGLVRFAAWRASGADPFWSRFHLATVHARRPLEPRELFDADRLERTRGAEVAAPLGEALVATCVALADEGVAPRLAAALADGPPRGEAAGRALLADLGLDPDAVWQGVLAVAEDDSWGDPRARVALPRLDPLEETQDWTDPFGVRRRRILAVPDMDVPPGWEVVCRVRFLGPGAPAGAVAGVSAGLERTGGCWQFWVPGAGLDLVLRVQLGLRPLEPRPLLDEPIWEEWATHQR